MGRDRSVVVRRGRADAVLVVPGLGMRWRGRRAVRRFFERSDLDLFMPDYVKRGSLDDAAGRLSAFIERERLLHYPRLHVYANILGAWTVNRCLRAHPLPNLCSLVYDRSPIQERAPALVTELVPWGARLVLGTLVEDLAAAPYPRVPPDATPQLRIGLLIETRASLLMRVLRRLALRRGALDFGAGAFGQPHHDLAYIPFDHDRVYTRIDAFGDEILAFFRAGRFSPHAQREPPDPATVWRR